MPKNKTDSMPTFGTSTIESVSISDIIVDQKYQFRVACDPVVVENYALLISEGVKFPPITLFRIVDPKSEILGKVVLVAGFQRLEAYQINDYRKLECEIYEGTEDDASMFALPSNSRHGSAYTHADKRKVVRSAFNHPIMKKWSDNRLSKYLGVSQGFVSSEHRKYDEERGIEEETRVVDAIASDGRNYTIDVKKASKTKAENKIALSLEPEPKQDNTVALINTPEPDQELELAQLHITPEEIYIKSGQTYGDTSIKVSLGSLKSLLKIGDAYDLSIYAGDLTWLVKNQAVIMKHSNLALMCLTGEDITQTENIDTLASRFNLNLVAGNPVAIAYYCSKNITIPDRSYSDHCLHLAEIVKPYVASKGSVLVINPVEPVVEVFHSIDRKCHVFYSEANIELAHRELSIAKVLGLDLQLLT